METKIEICLAANAKYFPGMFNTAASIAMFANRDYQLSFNLLGTDIGDADYVFLESRVSRIHGNVEFHRFNIAEHDFSELQDWHGNKLAYARFLIGWLRPELEYVIYSDVDMLWLADIAKLWEMRDPNISIQGPYDGHSYDIGEDVIFAQQGYCFNEDEYYCSGLLLMNLRRMRERKIAERCVEFLKSNHSFICPDQSALNIITKGDSAILPRMWMKFTFDIRENRLTTPIVLHYANEIPWLRDRGSDLLTDTVLLWFCIHAYACGESIWYTLRRYFSPRRIILSRLLFICISNTILSFIIHVVMKFFGCTTAFWRMKKWAQRVHIEISSGIDANILPRGNFRLFTVS